MKSYIKCVRRTFVLCKSPSSQEIQRWSIVTVYNCIYIHFLTSDYRWTSMVYFLTAIVFIFNFTERDNNWLFFIVLFCFIFFFFLKNLQATKRIKKKKIMRGKIQKFTITKMSQTSPHVSLFILLSLHIIRKLVNLLTNHYYWKHIYSFPTFLFTLPRLQNIVKTKYIIRGKTLISQSLEQTA